MIVWVLGKINVHFWKIIRKIISLLSKKDPNIRQKELLDFCKDYFLEYFSENITSMLKDGFKGYMMVELIERLSGKLFKRWFCKTLSNLNWIYSGRWFVKILHIIEFGFEWFVVGTSSRRKLDWTSNCAQCSTPFNHRWRETTKLEWTDVKFDR